MYVTSIQFGTTSKLFVTPVQLCSKFGTTSKMFVHDGAHHPPTRNQAAALESIAKFILQFVPTGTNTRENAGITAAATALM